MAGRIPGTILLLLVCAVMATAADPAAGPGKGSLVIVGGGKLPRDIVQRFVALAGGAGANFVVIPTAAAEKRLRLETVRRAFMKEFGAKNVTVLHTRERKKADSEEFAEPLRQANGVWFTGGRHWRLADTYLGTRTEQEIKALLDRGGVVGGTSAGATILGSYMVRGAAGADDADGDNRIMMAPGHETGLGLLRNATIDQHLLARHRENDLVPVIEAHPGLLGIGIDESTAIVVHGDAFEVIGKSKVGIYDGKDHGGKKYFFLSRGQKFDLARLRQF